MAYNMTGVENSRNLLDLFTAADVITGGFLIRGGMIVLWVILVMVLMRRTDPTEAVTAASFALSVLCVAFLTAGVISQVWLVGFTIVTVVGAIALYIRE